MSGTGHQRQTADAAPRDRGPQTDTYPQRDFWLAHIRTGFVIFMAETLAVMAYLGWTPHRPHREALWLLAGSWLVTGIAGLWSAPWMAAKGWRVAYSVAWTVLSAFAVGTVAVLDSGLDSPLLVLLLLPVAYAALAFTAQAAALCGLATIAAATLATLTDPAVDRSEPDAFMFFAEVIGVTLLSVAAAANRSRHELHEQQLMAKIIEMAEVDDLTGCAVPRVFRRRAEEEIERAVRHDRPLSLLMIDVDKFKSVNDALGHLAGDRVLAAIGAVLRSNTRSFDLAGRLGGDEFAILAPDTDRQAAGALADRIHLAFAQSVEVPVTLSIGVSSCDMSAPTAEQMINDADIALYEAKRLSGDANAVRHPTTPPPHPRLPPASKGRAATH